LFLNHSFSAATTCLQSFVPKCHISDFQAVSVYYIPPVVALVVLFQADSIATTLKALLDTEKRR
jgi:hypothetical protein